MYTYSQPIRLYHSKYWTGHRSRKVLRRHFWRFLGFILGFLDFQKESLTAWNSFVCIYFFIIIIIIYFLPLSVENFERELTISLTSGVCFSRSIMRWQFKFPNFASHIYIWPPISRYLCIEQPLPFGPLNWLVLRIVIRHCYMVTLIYRNTILWSQGTLFDFEGGSRFLRRGCSNKNRVTDFFFFFAEYQIR